MADLEALKAKYSSVLGVGENVGLNVAHLHIDSDKLYLEGTVPSEHAKNEIWDAVKSVDAAYGDINPNLTVGATKYNVQSGDTLSKIAKHAYGDAGKYHSIFNANTDILDNPDNIQIGQELTLPAL